MLDQAAVERLKAMKIPVWVSRRHARTDRTATGPNEAEPRVRLEAGTGAWLLVVDEAQRQTHSTLLADIRAAIGVAECRFGWWSDSAEAGVAAGEWADHGIEHVLTFDRPPVAADRIIEGDPLETLASSPEARRRLWQRLRPRLGR